MVNRWGNNGNSDRLLFSWAPKLLRMVIIAMKLEDAYLKYGGGHLHLNIVLAFLVGSAVKNPPANAGDTGSMPGSGRSPGEGTGDPLQYSCLGNLLQLIFATWEWGPRIDGTCDFSREARN